MNTYAAIEAGGTKWVCGMGTGPGDLETTQIPTTSPGETIAAALAFFQNRDLAALGIGSFGPVDLNRASPRYGFITSTPKPGWRNTDVAGAFHRALNIPVGFDTDVNAAALGEARWGAARDVSSCVYLTVGTGIGGGAILDGNLLHGLLHPEMGHIRLPHDLREDPFPGACPFHGDCLEGLASGPAIQARWGTPARDLPPDHPAWQLEANYLALAIANILFTISPARVILGGGVMQQSQLFPLIHTRLAEIVADYLPLPEEFVVPPGLGARSGILGALALAETAHRTAPELRPADSD